MEYFAQHWAWLILPLLYFAVRLKHRSIFKKTIAARDLEELWKQLDFLSDVDARDLSEWGREDLKDRKRENIEHFKLRLIIQISENTSAAAFYLLLIVILLALILINIG